MRIIKNTTNLDARKLRSLFSFVHNLIAKDEGRLKHWKELKVQIDNRSYNYSGKAYVGQVYGHGWDILLNYSINKKQIEIANISQLFAHELMHSFGYQDTKKQAGIPTQGLVFKRQPLTEQQIESIKKKFDGIDFNREEKPKVKINHVALRKEKTERNLANWERKLSFAKNKVKKYRQKVSYYA